MEADDRTGLRSVAIEPPSRVDGPPYISTRAAIVPIGSLPMADEHEPTMRELMDQAGQVSTWKPIAVSFEDAVLAELRRIRVAVTVLAVIAIIGFTGALMATLVAYS